MVVCLVAGALLDGGGMGAQVVMNVEKSRLKSEKGSAVM